MTTASLKTPSLGIADHKRRLLRFGLVGSSGVVVNSALLYLLIEAVGLNHLVAAALATEATILYNFSLNDRWAFRDVESGISWTRRALRYNSIALGGLMISVAVLAAFAHFLSMNYLFANLFAIGAATLWNYAVNSCFTWRTMPIRNFWGRLLTMLSLDTGLTPWRACRRGGRGRAHEALSKGAFLPVACRSRAALPGSSHLAIQLQRSHRGSTLV